MLFGPNSQGEILGLVRFDQHDELPHNVEFVRVIFSIERFENVTELLEDKKGWDALNVKAICKRRQGDKAANKGSKGQQADVTDELVKHTQDLRL